MGRHGVPRTANRFLPVILNFRLSVGDRSIANHAEGSQTELSESSRWFPKNHTPIAPVA